MRNAALRHVWLDCTHLEQESFGKHFPTILQKCRERGLDPATQMLPVVPAAHYCCGGIRTDVHGQTSVSHLYAIGESACTGLHGTNRLASNSLPEALVFAARASKHATAGKKSPPFLPGECKTKLTTSKQKKHATAEKKHLQDVMNGISIVTTELELLKAASIVDSLHDRWNRYSDGITADVAELKNMIVVARLIVNASLRQMQNTVSPLKSQTHALAPQFTDELNRLPA
jgi:L-aspartate oxidase